jgi:hypothetical protein
MFLGMSNMCLVGSVFLLFNINICLSARFSVSVSVSVSVFISVFVSVSVSASVANISLATDLIVKIKVKVKAQLLLKSKLFLNLDCTEGSKVSKEKFFLNEEELNVKPFVDIILSSSYFSFQGDFDTWMDLSNCGGPNVVPFDDGRGAEKVAAAAATAASSPLQR